MNFNVPRIHNEDQNTQRFFDQISNIVNQLDLNPLLKGQLLEGISIVSGDNIINHKLGRKLVGWIQVRTINNNNDYYDKQDTNPSPDKTLILNSAATDTLSLWVF